MGIWKGIYLGLQDVEEKKLQKDQLEAARQEKLADRLEQRKMLAFEYAAKRGAKAKSDGAPGGVDHYSAVLKGYGMSPEKIADLGVKGGSTALKTVADYLESNKDKTRVWTPEQVDEIGRTAIVTVNKGGPLEYKDIMEGFGVDVTPEDEAFAQTVLQTPTSVDVTIPKMTTPPLTVQEIGGVKDAATKDLSDSLSTRLAELRDAASKATPGSSEANTVAVELEKTNQALDALKGGNIKSAVDLVGAEVLLPYYQQDPRLFNTTLGGYWDSVAPKGSFSSTEEIQSAISRGMLQEGDVVMFQGKPLTLKRK